MENKYPEHDKLKKVKDSSQEIGSFLDWCQSQGWTLRKWYEDDTYSGYISVGLTIEEMLARFYSIDLTKLREEKEQALGEVRKLQEKD